MVDVKSKFRAGNLQPEKAFNPGYTTVYGGILRHGQKLEKKRCVASAKHRLPLLPSLENFMSMVGGP